MDLEQKHPILHCESRFLGTDPDQRAKELNRLWLALSEQALLCSEASKEPRP